LAPSVCNIYMTTLLARDLSYNIHVAAVNKWINYCNTLSHAGSGAAAMQ